MRNHLPKLVLFSTIILWQILSINSNIYFFFSSPLSIIISLQESILSLELVTAFFVSLSEIILGLFFGLSLGVLCTYLFWKNQIVKEIAQPYLHILGIIPLFAFAPIFIVWFGTGLLLKVSIATIGCLLFIQHICNDAIENLDTKALVFFKMLAADKYVLFQKLILPTIVDVMIRNSSNVIAIVIMGVFIGEFISSSDGLGHFILHASSLYNMSYVFVGCVAITLVTQLFAILNKFVTDNKQIIISKISVSAIR